MPTLDDDTLLFGAFLEEEDGALLGMAGGVGDIGGGAAAVTFPVTPLKILVELFLGGAWVDVSARVLYEQAIVINRGRRSSQRRSTPATCALTFLNDDQALSPRNVASPYAGMLRPNTPLRVSVDPGSGPVRRFTGRVPSWKPAIPVGGRNARTVPVTAAGRRQRLERGDDVLRSPLYRAVVDASSPQPTAYWSLETEPHGTLSTEAPSPIAGVGPLSVTAGEVAFGSAAGPVGSAPVASFTSGGRLSGQVPARNGVFTPGHRTELAVRWDALDTGDIQVALDVYSFGTVLKWEIVATDLASGGLFLQWVLAAGGTGGVYSNLRVDDGLWHWIALDVLVAGADAAYTLYLDDAVALSGTIVGAGVGYPYAIEINPTGVPDQAVPSVGHITVWGAYNPGTGSPAGADLYPAFLGHTGELTTERFARLCEEEGLGYEIVQLVTETERMGAQRTGASLGQLLDDIEDVNEGFIDENVNDALRLTSRTGRWNREIALVVDYGAGKVLALESGDEAETLRNWWTITRSGGITAIDFRTTGPNNINESENDLQGAGEVRDGATIAAYDDSQARTHAIYRVNRDTVDKPYFSRLGISFTKNPELITRWLATDVNSRIVLTTPPADLGPDTADQVIEGYAETIDQKTWAAVLNTSPNDVNRVGLYDGTEPRYDCSKSSLNSALTSTATAVDVLVEDVCLWAHDNGDYLIVINGEWMSVSAVSAAAGSYPSRTQTLTVTRSVNGVVKSHPAGYDSYTADRYSQVHIKDFAVYAL